VLFWLQAREKNIQAGSPFKKFSFKNFYLEQGEVFGVPRPGQHCSNRLIHLSRQEKGSNRLYCKRDE
tara:strand:- start:212 stop:412 length:201 start_codon:yes stop_codon:yes gene_type:complete